MRLLAVRYGSQETYLRDWHEDGPWLKGIECDEHGVANRDGCAEAELWIARKRIVSMEPAERKESA